MKFFATLFTALNLALIPAAYANVDSTLIAKAPYIASEIIRISDTCPEGTMSDDQVKATAQKAGLTVGQVVKIEGEVFAKVMAVMNNMAPPPAGTTSFKVFQIEHGGELSVFFSAQNAEGCSLGGLRMSLEFFRSILEAAEGQPA